MKICPRCQKTYSDDTLNFCLEDGSVLSSMVAQPPQTVQVNEPRPTQPQQQGQSVPTVQAGWNVAPQPYSMQPPKKSSKTWVWVLLILGAVVILCGGGFAGLLFYAASQADKASNENPPPASPSNKGSNLSPSNKDTNVATSNSDSGSRMRLEKIDFSKWVPESSLYADVE